ncbi:hypothetical protein TDB9533_01059 [Thalassocella blandensis]|nr:hypothetical protein TDB9533_01059 [Thalassocella blandensis]
MFLVSVRSFASNPNCLQERSLEHLSCRQLENLTTVRPLPVEETLREFRHQTDTSLMHPEKAVENRSFAHLLDDHREYFANQFQELTNSIDRYMAQNHYDGKYRNESYFIIDSEAIFNEIGSHEFNLRGKAKADLSNTQKRIKLIFESQPEEDLSLDDGERPNRNTNRDLTSDGAIAGLEYSRKKDPFEWRPSIDVGSRLHFPVDIFARFKLAKKTRTGQKSVLSTRFEYPYFAREGAKPSTRIAWLYEFSESFGFTSVSRYKYTEKERYNEWSQSFQINHYYNDELGLEYKIGAVGNDDYHSDFSTYYVQTALKINMYDHWIFLTLVPAVEYSEENNWNADTSFSLRLQLIYAD